MRGGAAWRSDIVRLAVFVIVLGAIAWLAPAPWNPTDRDDYEMVGREMIVPSCSSLHCFRMLVPIVIEHLPGSSIVKWKAYAALANALAALAVLRLTLAFGLTMHAARLAAWLSLMGFGSLYTLFDPHTADPLMYFLGPAMTLVLLQDRGNRAAVIAAVGVFAKEFAAAPLWIAAWANAIAKRWGPMLRAGLAAFSVTVLWLIFQLTFVTVFDYSYGDNPPSTMFHGGYLAHWVGELGPRAAIVAVLTTFGAVYVLAPAGLPFAPVRLRQWTIACLPALIAFCYVQQPDRALWNFHFVVMPLAALVLARLPNAMAWGFVAVYAAANLRSGAQLPWVPSARLFLLVSTVTAIAAVIHVRRSTATLSAAGGEAIPADLPLTGAERRRIPLVIALNTIALIAAAVVMLDASKHRQSEREFGVNKWGYRGTVMPPRRPDEKRIVILGGEIAYGSRVPWEESFPFYLQRNMRQGWRKLYLDGASVINLSTPVDAAGSFAATVVDYDYLQPDVYVFMIDPQHAPGESGGWRRESAIFRKTGYLPLVTRPLWQTDTGARAAAADPDALCEMVVAAVDMAVSRGGKALIVNVPAPLATAANDEVVASRIGRRFTDPSRVRYLDLRRAIDFTDTKLSTDGVTLTARGNDELAERLTDRTLEMVRQ